MADEEPKHLPRRVGHMGYEQIRALFDESRAKINTHHEAVQRGEYCPDC